MLNFVNTFYRISNGYCLLVIVYLLLVTVIVLLPSTTDADASFVSCRCLPLYSANALHEPSQAFHQTVLSILTTN